MKGLQALLCSFPAWKDKCSHGNLCAWLPAADGSDCGTALCSLRPSVIAMVLIDIPIPINIFNALKFAAVELLVSFLLEPAWELIISRAAHARVVRGERVTLSALPKSRTFPCALTIG